MKKKLYSKCLLPIIFLIFLSCSKEKEIASPVSVIVYPVIAAEVPKTSIVVGQVVPKENVYLVARVTGFLTKRLFEPGAYVKKGELLFQIQKDQYVAQVERAKSELIKNEAVYDNTLIEFKRQAVLYKQNATSQENLDNATQNKIIAEGNVGSAVADLSLQELNLSYTDIFSPFDGRIGMYTYSVGNEVSESSNPLAQVIMVDPMWVEFPISEKGLANVMEREDIIPTERSEKIVDAFVVIRAILSNGEEYPLKGKIDFINNEINPLTGTIQMRAVFQNPNEKLIPGGYVTVKVESVKKTRHLLIFQAAMQDDQLGTFVYTVDKDSFVHKRYIKKGEAIDTQIIVNDGLEEGEMVVVAGVLRVRPGMKVDRVLNNYNVNFSAILPKHALSDTKSTSESSLSDSDRNTKNR